MAIGFRHRFHPVTKCLAARAGLASSHNNVFQAALGMLDVSTVAYSPAADVFRACHVGGELIGRVLKDDA
ncbi:MAG: hypothetical protein ACT4PQ_14610 [Betaproteobacteria bacterium]